MGKLIRIAVIYNCTSCTGRFTSFTATDDSPLVILDFPAGNYIVDVIAVDISNDIIRTVEVIVMSEDVTTDMSPTSVPVTNVLTTDVPTATSVPTTNMSLTSGPSTHIVLTTTNVPTPTATVSTTTPFGMSTYTPGTVNVSTTITVSTSTPTSTNTHTSTTTDASVTNVSTI